MSVRIQSVKLNQLEYNTNRDPKSYRRHPGEDFSLAARLAGQGTAKVRFEVGGKVVCEQAVELPGLFHCQTKFDQCGTYLGKLVVDGGGEQRVRLDVVEHHW